MKKIINNILIKNILLVACLIVLAVGWRIVNFNYQIAPNLELVTVASVVAAITIGWRAALVVPLASMMISDNIIGNTSIYMFTWGAFALIGLGATLLNKMSNKPKKQILSSIGFAISSSFIFFLITNFGVWVQGWYPATIDGLISSYVMAIPFYRTMLIGNLILIPSAVTLLQYVKNNKTTKSLVVDSLVG